MARRKLCLQSVFGTVAFDSYIGYCMHYISNPGMEPCYPLRTFWLPVVLREGFGPPNHPQWIWLRWALSDRVSK